MKTKETKEDKNKPFDEDAGCYPPTPDAPDKKFAVIFRTKEARSSAAKTNNAIVMREDRSCWVTNEPGNWVPATSIPGKRSVIPKDVKIWKTQEEAEEFMLKWGGHPWYAVPKQWEVVEIIPVMKTVLSHYKVAKDPNHARRRPD